MGVLPRYCYCQPSLPWFVSSRIKDYGKQDTDQLAAIYSSIENLAASKVAWSKWDGKGLKIPLFNNTDIDSIKLVCHKKSEGKYYRNGVKKQYTLAGKELEKFVAKASELTPVVPYNKGDYEILTARTDQYSMVVYYKNGETEWIKYDGERLMKESYLFYESRKNIVKPYLKKKLTCPNKRYSTCLY